MPEPGSEPFVGAVIAFAAEYVDSTLSMSRGTSGSKRVNTERLHVVIGVSALLPGNAPLLKLAL